MGMAHTHEFSIYVYLGRLMLRNRIKLSHDGDKSVWHIIALIGNNFSALDDKKIIATDQEWMVCDKCFVIY